MPSIEASLSLRSSSFRGQVNCGKFLISRAVKMLNDLGKTT
jgi:hypothetical protein